MNWEPFRRSIIEIWLLSSTDVPDDGILAGLVESWLHFPHDMILEAFEP